MEARFLIAPFFVGMDACELLVPSGLRADSVGFLANFPLFLKIAFLRRTEDLVSMIIRFERGSKECRYANLNYAKLGCFSLL
eukprot:m.126705 g.126705  ORF g.126705 m.126705 type:complete len:82 (+) comp14522_c0_seq1:2766-3011(+)